MFWIGLIIGLLIGLAIGVFAFIIYLLKIWDDSGLWDTR